MDPENYVAVGGGGGIRGGGTDIFFNKKSSTYFTEGRTYLTREAIGSLESDCFLLVGFVPMYLRKPLATCNFQVPNSRPRLCCCKNTKNVWFVWRFPKYYIVPSQRNNLIKLSPYDEINKRAHYLQKVRAKGNSICLRATVGPAKDKHQAPTN